MSFSHVTDGETGTKGSVLGWGQEAGGLGASYPGMSSEL